MKILILGDIMGRPGRLAVTALLPDLKKKLGIDLVVANAENLAHGKGVTTGTLGEVLSAGVDILTGGNHIFEAQGFTLLDDPAYARCLLRPANYPPATPGKGTLVTTVGGQEVLVISLLCRVNMKDAALLEDPFRTFDRIRQAYPEPRVVLVDLHGETSSERTAFGWYADGRATAVWGTHTHVPTADTRLLLQGTAYQTDIGMTGFADGVIGVSKEGPIQGFLSGLPPKKEIPESGRAVLNALVVDIDSTGRATAVERIQQHVNV